MSMNPEKLGPYRISRKLGEGAMGAVFHGVDENTNEEVAVKLLPPALGAQRGFEERFEAEIETLRKLEHPNIVQIQGFGEQDGLHFYAMEFVDGRTLEDEVDDGRRFTWREIIDIGKQICAALKHAHDRGIIHRDLKPANLMLTAEGKVKLADFGIARLYGHTGMTAAGGPIGTATYMSPEQTDGSNVSPRSDLYSLGCVFYCLMTGRPPFQADNLQQMLRLQKSAIHEPLSSRIGGVPPELDLIVNKLLEKNPADRIPTAATLAKSLAAVDDAVKLRDQTVTGAQPAPPSQASRGLAPTPPNENTTEAPASRSRVAADQSADVTIDSVPVDSNATLASAPAVDLDPDATQAGKADPYELADDPDATTASPPRTLAPGSTVQLGDEPAQADPDATAASNASVYITRDEAAAHDREVDQQRRRDKPFIIGTDTIKFIVVLILLTIATLWYMAPPSADKLAARIEALVVEDEPEDSEYLEAAEVVRELAKYHPEDARLKNFEFVLVEAELIRDARKLKNTARRLHRRGAKSAIERTYLEAVAYLEVDAEVTLSRLQAMVDLYNEPTVQKDEEIRKYLTLAIRQIEEMKEKTAGYSSEHLQLINDRLIRAESLRNENTDEARKIAHAIVILYGDKQWAQTPVTKARHFLRALDQ